MVDTRVSRRERSDGASPLPGASEAMAPPSRRERSDGASPLPGASKAMAPPPFPARAKRWRLPSSSPPSPDLSRSRPCGWVGRSPSHPSGGGACGRVDEGPPHSRSRPPPRPAGAPTRTPVHKSTPTARLPVPPPDEHVFVGANRNLWPTYGRISTASPDSGARTGTYDRHGVVSLPEVPIRGRRSELAGEIAEYLGQKFPSGEILLTGDEPGIGDRSCAERERAAYRSRPLMRSLLATRPPLST